MRNHTFGFTIIELLVTSSILVIIALIVVVSFSGYEAQENLRQIKDTLVSDILDMQNAALSGRKIFVCVNNGELKPKTCSTDTDCTSVGYQSCQSYFPPGGYGVRINDCSTSSNCTYTLFADIDNNRFYSFGGGYYDDETLIDGSRTLPNSQKLYLSDTSYRSFGGSSWYSIKPPIDIFFRKDGSIIVKIVNGYYVNITQRIVYSTPDSTNDILLFINTNSGIVWGEVGVPEPASSL